ncbi:MULTISPECIES: hypothetical protein [Nocardia]|nr:MULTISPECIES: hypothetical protein [Nocardia]
MGRAGRVRGVVVALIDDIGPPGFVGIQDLPCDPDACDAPA